MANTIFLRLEGPLQAWGVRAHWEERDTASEPTKSGVIGLIGCAMGLRRDADALRALSDALMMGVRVDRQGTPLADYHTTGGAKMRDGRPEGMLNAEGKHKRETDVSTRRYLMDASFLVALQGAADTIAAVERALADPIWPLFLGRKACVPTEPVLVGTGDFASLKEALETTAKRTDNPNDADDALERARFAQRDIHREKTPPSYLRLVLECAPGEGNARNDAIGVPSRRLFWPRYVDISFMSFGRAETPALDTMEG